MLSWKAIQLDNAASSGKTLCIVGQSVRPSIHRTFRSPWRTEWIIWRANVSTAKLCRLQSGASCVRTPIGCHPSDPLEKSCKPGAHETDSALRGRRILVEHRCAASVEPTSPVLLLVVGRTPPLGSFPPSSFIYVRVAVVRWLR